MLALQLEHLVEQLLPPLFAVGLCAIHLVYIVGKLLDGEHITVVGNGDTGHTIFDSLIYKFFDTRLTIEEGVLGVGM